MVSDIPAGEGKTANLFFTVYGVSTLNYMKDQNYELRCVQVEIVDIITLERRTRVREGGGGVGAVGRLGFVVAGERTPRATAGEAASPAEVGFSPLAN